MTAFGHLKMITFPGVKNSQCTKVIISRVWKHSIVGNVGKHNKCAAFQKKKNGICTVIV